MVVCSDSSFASCLKDGCISRARDAIVTGIPQAVVEGDIDVVIGGCEVSAWCKESCCNANVGCQQYAINDIDALYDAIEIAENGPVVILVNIVIAINI